MRNNTLLFLGLRSLWGCHGFDWEVKYWLHAEGIGWPPKKAGKQLSANNSTFASDEEAEFLLAA